MGLICKYGGRECDGCGLCHEREFWGEDDYEDYDEEGDIE